MNLHDQFDSYFGRIQYGYFDKWYLIPIWSMEFALHPINVSNHLHRVVGKYWGNINMGKSERMQHINENHIECSLFDLRWFVYGYTSIIWSMIAIQSFRSICVTNMFSFHVLIDELDIGFIIQYTLLHYMFQLTCIKYLYQAIHVEVNSCSKFISLPWSIDIIQDMIGLLCLASI